MAVSGGAAAQIAACESGQAAAQQQLFVTALSLLTRCLETKGLSDHNIAAALQMRASAYAHTENPVKASEDYRESLRVKPADIAWDLIPLAIYLRDAGQPAQSLEVLQDALVLDEDGPGSGPGMAVYFHLGWTLHEMRRYAEAIEAYTKGIEKQPRFEGIYLRRALSSEAIGERGKARRDLQKILDIGYERGLDPATAPDEYRSMFIKYGLIPGK
jgi:tetratricopeptide (TPR) repeat protein